MKQKGQAIRNRIIETADNLFYQQGFNHTSFSDIADASGIARGNFYYYFKTKDEILTAVIEQRQAAIHELLRQWTAEVADPRQRLKHYVGILSGVQSQIRQYGCPVGSLCSELGKLRHALQSEATEIFALFRDWLEEQFRLLGHGAAAKQLAMHLLARTQGVSLITNAFADERFLQEEVSDLETWIDSL